MHICQAFGVCYDSEVLTVTHVCCEIISPDDHFWRKKYFIWEYFTAPTPHDCNNLSSVIVFKLLLYSICFSQLPCRVWCCRCFVSVLQMRCLRLREVEKFAQGCTSGNEERLWLLGLLALLASGSCDWNLSRAAFPVVPSAGVQSSGRHQALGSGRPRPRMGWPQPQWLNLY